jgi:glucan phosphoethanolaminetransferase (alkaline phosphatase superfamily)
MKNEKKTIYKWQVFRLLSTGVLFLCFFGQAIYKLFNPNSQYLSNTLFITWVFLVPRALLFLVFIVLSFLSLKLKYKDKTEIPVSELFVWLSASVVALAFVLITIGVILDLNNHNLGFIQTLSWTFFLSEALLFFAVCIVLLILSIRQKDIEERKTVDDITSNWDKNV